MASGLLALLDDVATLADDVATLTLASAKKTSGVVTDDLAVTAEQTIGMAREREIPAVLRVAWGSLLNKALLLAPGALFLSWIAPWTIHPLLMAGGLFLCFEGVEKVLHKVLPHDDHGHDEGHAVHLDPRAFEDARVKGAIRTDLILSAEIVAITLGEIEQATFGTRVAVLYAVSLVVTVGVYGLVAALVKLDDAGEALVRRGGGGAGLGRALVAGTPKLMHTISWVGMIAMLMVGGHILLEGIHPLEEAVHHALHDLPAGVAGIASVIADVIVGGVFGGLVVAALTVLRRWRA